MELKKSRKADLEKNKTIFFLFGLLIAEAIVFSFFEFYHSGEEKEVVFAGSNQIVVEEQILQTEQQKEVAPPPPEQTVATTIINVVQDNVKVEDFSIDAEADESSKFDEIVFVEDTKVEEVHEMEIFKVVEEEPAFPGGEEARIKFLKDNIVYPKIARETNQEGTIRVGFVVERDGSITHVKVLRGESPALCEEAIRVTKMMPKWKPGKQRNKAVRVEFSMPITFTLY
ncbi:MAG: energy transducer TonB [Bacteroidales bacterium]|jgi:protein TonB|nr:energy transducer TonB [Bacteroidales bacterium]